jgi:lipopolysaccharide transport system permease protein
MSGTSLRTRFGCRCQRLARPGNRTILLEMVRANIKASDYHSFLGGIWSLVGTAVMLACFYYVFSRHFGQKIPGYPLYLLTGIILVNFFITATSHLLKALRFNRDIALNSTIPRENLVLATISINIWKFGIELALCIVISMWYGFFGWRSALLLLPVLLSFLALVLGVGVALSLLFCFARDVEHIWTIFSRLFLFVTPVFYTAESLSPNMSVLISYLNPLSSYLKAFRTIFMNSGALGASDLVRCFLWGPFVLIVSYLVFLRWEGEALDRT